MSTTASFIPNVENSFEYEEFEYLFGCQCDEEKQFCSVEGNECPITTQ